MVTVPPPPASKDNARRKKARDALVAVLWNADGTRRLPKEAALVDALSACHRDDVWWVCEANSASPLYFLPTQEWVRLAASFIASLGLRSVLEIGAGDGFVAHHLQKQKAMSKIRYIATDNAAWAKPRGRMSDADRREFADVPFAGLGLGVGVERVAATTAVKKYEPDLVLAVWPPPGVLVERAIQGPCKFVLDISVDGDVCGNGPYTWRFEHAVAAGPVSDRALCRLDARPRRERHTRITLYRGGRS